MIVTSLMPCKTITKAIQFFTPFHPIERVGVLLISNKVGSWNLRKVDEVLSTYTSSALYAS